MSLSQEEFDSHPVWQMEESVSKFLASAADSVSGEALADVPTLNNIRSALADVRSVGTIEPWRIPNTGPLDLLRNVLNNLNDELAELDRNSEVSRKLFLESYLDDLVSALQAFPLYQVQTEAAVEMKKALQAEREFLEGTVQWLHDAVNEDSASVGKLRASIAAEETKISEQVKRLDEALNTQNNTFMNRVAEWKKESEAAAASIVATGDKHLASLKELEQQSRNLVDATSRHTITAEYGDYANKQERAGFWWSAGAVAAAIGGFIYLSFVLAGIHSASVAETIAKATVSSLVVLGAGFMSRESSGHRKEARDARRTQLDLNALDPFLTKLDEDEANDLRREFAQKIFGRPLANDKRQKPYEWVVDKLRGDEKKADAEVDA